MTDLRSRPLAVGIKHDGDGRGAAGRTPTFASMDTLVQLEKVTKRYDSAGSVTAAPALDAVSMRIDNGEAVAIMGPSGSGKSTLLNLIAGLDRPTSGTVRVGDERVDMLSEAGAARFRRRQVGMIFQFFNLLDDMTVIDNVLLPAQLAGARTHHARRRADELIDTLRIGHRRDAYPARLSGGERQRVAIARALLRNPRLLLLDEATSQLDAINEAALRETVAEVADRITVLVVAHRLSTVTLADRIIVMDAGRVQAAGTHSELVAANPLYAELAATQFLAAAV
jgi:putative ABC transport system ATP-binding protein